MIREYMIDDTFNLIRMVDFVFTTRKNGGSLTAASSPGIGNEWI
jgi:hypothetical protein